MGLTKLPVDQEPRRQRESGYSIRQGRARLKNKYKLLLQRLRRFAIVFLKSKYSSALACQLPPKAMDLGPMAFSVVRRVSRLQLSLTRRDGKADR